MAFGLVPVDEDELNELFEMFNVYWTELEGFEPVAADLMASANRRAEMVLNAEDQEWLWIEIDGTHVGFMMLQTLYNEPLIDLRTLEIRDLYIEPASRRQGLAKAAVEALLVRERQHATSLVEASVLRDNQPALEFWEAMGFAVRSHRTARRP
jgi:ribosomal protein S18 acetylase RimI-like enzyme